MQNHNSALGIKLSDRFGLLSLIITYAKNKNKKNYVHTCVFLMQCSLHSSQVGEQTATGINKYGEGKAEIHIQTGRYRSMQMISISKAVVLKRSSLQ